MRNYGAIEMSSLWGNRSEQLCGYINEQLWGYNEHIMGHTACIKKSIAFQMQIDALWRVNSLGTGRQFVDADQK
jgi:hypothetical protein